MPGHGRRLRHRNRHPVVAHGHSAPGQRTQAERRAIPLRHRVGVRGRGQFDAQPRTGGARLPADGKAKDRARRPRFDEKRAQFQRVEAFFAQLPQCRRLASGGVNEYATPSEFKTLLRRTGGNPYRRLQPSAATANLHRPPPRSRPNTTTGCGAAWRRSSCWGPRKAVRSP